MLEGPLVLMAVMLLQLGGVPNYLISKLGKGAWVAWMLLVVGQFLSTFAVATSNVLSYASFEARFRQCFVELNTGHAFLNVILPSTALLPLLITPLFTMLVYVQ